MGQCILALVMAMKFKACADSPANRGSDTADCWMTVAPCSEGQLDRQPGL